MLVVVLALSEVVVHLAGRTVVVLFVRPVISSSSATANRLVGPGLVALLFLVFCWAFMGHIFLFGVLFTFLLRLLVGLVMLLLAIAPEVLLPSASATARTLVTTSFSISSCFS